MVDSQKNKKNYLHPFNAFIPQKGIANKTIAPLYDTLSSDEARELGLVSARSFLHVTKAEIDFDHRIPYNNPKVYQRAAENLQKFIDDQVFIQQDQPVYLLYKIETMNTSQLGLVAVCETDAIHDDYIKLHELTRDQKENDRYKNILTVGGSISPVMLTHKHNDNVSSVLEQLADREPDITAEDNYKIIHKLYIINDPEDIKLIQQSYDNIENIYMADGHHRTQAAARVAEQLKNNESAQKFLVTIFPEEQLNILGYHRVINDLNGYTTDEFLLVMFDYFEVNPSEHAVLPHRINEFGMYLNKRWYKLVLKEEYIDQNSRVDAKLDSTILNDLILSPVLGIHDIQTDSRIDFIGGSRPYTEIEKYVDAQEQGVGFTLAATSIQDLFKISDQKLLMPPKSTWFYPKLCDGLFFYMFNK